MRPIYPYVVKRLLHAVVVVWAAYTVTFLVLYSLPSDPIAIMVGPEVSLTDEQMESLKAQHGLDQPLLTQYFQRLGSLLTGDLGISITSGRPVTQTIGSVLPSTLQLAGASLVLAIGLGFILALAVGFAGSRGARNFLLSLPPLAMTLPVFWLGLILIQLFSFRLGWLPAVGNSGWRHLVLPAITLAVPGAAIIAQVLAKSLLATLRLPFVEMARAKGVGRSAVLLRHAFRNSVIPAMTMVGMMVAGVLGGAVVVETVFSRAGVGRLAHEAAGAQDFPVIQGIVVLAAAVFALSSLIIDLLYPLVDPRVVIDPPNRRRERAASA